MLYFQVCFSPYAVNTLKHLSFYSEQSLIFSHNGYLDGSCGTDMKIMVITC